MQYWLNLQRNFDLAVAERAFGQSMKQLRRRKAACSQSNKVKRHLVA